MYKRILLIPLAAAACVCASAQTQTSVKPANVVEQEWPRKNQISDPMTGTIDGYRGIWFTLGQFAPDYGDKYSGGLGTYTAKHIPLAVYSKEADKTFFVYGGCPAPKEKYLLCMAGCYDHKTGMLQKPVIVHDKGCYKVFDPHDNPTMQIDKDGYLWVFVAGRGNTRHGIRYRSVRPYDITEWKYVNESVMAYPQVIYDNEKGFFLFETRYDGVRRTFFQTSPDGVNWSDYMPIASIMEPGDTRSGHYQFSNYDGKKLVCCFNRHPNGKCDERTNIYYIQSTDWGKTWTTADGVTPVELPILREEGPALVRNFRLEGKNCYIKDINFDVDGNPVIYYVTCDNHLAGPEGGERTHQIVRWDGKKWVYSTFAKSTHAYDTGSLWVEGKEWTIITPSQRGPQRWGGGGEMVMWKSANKGKSWKAVKQLTYDSPRNHGYARRPLNFQDDFYAFWADGNSDINSISYLYFCDKAGNVFRMPYNMTEEWAKPEPVFTGSPMKF